MFLPLLTYFTDAVTQLVTETEKAVRAAPDAYGAAAVALAVTGATVEGAYQALPAMHPRTVRRVLAGAGESVRMCMSSVCEGEGVHKDSIEDSDLDSIREQAEKAKVAPGVAESAVTRYGNSTERVQRVLDDLSALLGAGAKVWNPTGLFTRLMRSGQDVKLPERVVQARKAAESEKATRAARPVPEVGMLVRAFGEVCRIVELSRQFAVVETRDGLVNLARDNLRFVSP